MIGFLVLRTVENRDSPRIPVTGKKSKHNNRCLWPEQNHHVSWAESSVSFIKPEAGSHASTVSNYSESRAQSNSSSSGCFRSDSRITGEQDKLTPPCRVKLNNLHILCLSTINWCSKNSPNSWRSVPNLKDNLNIRQTSESRFTAIKEGLKNIFFQDHLEERFLSLQATKLLSILLIHKQTLKRVEHERKLMYFLFGPFITLEVDTSANVYYWIESCKRFNIVTKRLNKIASFRPPPPAPISCVI